MKNLTDLQLAKACDLNWDACQLIKKGTTPQAVVENMHPKRRTLLKSYHGASNDAELATSLEGHAKRN